MSLAQKNDQEAYEMGVSKAFKPIMENTLKYLNVGKSSDTSSKTDFSKVPNVQGDEVQKQRIASMLNLLNLLRLVMANKLNNNQLSQVPKSYHTVK